MPNQQLKKDFNRYGMNHFSWKITISLLLMYSWCINPKDWGIMQLVEASFQQAANSKK